MCSVQHREDGFSLVEILVALFIIALASAMVVMALPHRNDTVETEAVRFRDVLDRTVEQAISRGQVHGIRVGEHSYTIYTRMGGRWVQARGGVETLPGGMSLTVLARDGEADDIRPQIIADASGIVSGPSLLVTKGNRSHEIEIADPSGTNRHD